MGSTIMVGYAMITALIMWIWKRVKPQRSRRLLVLCVLAAGLLAATFLFRFDAHALGTSAEPPRLSIEVIAHPWWWEVHYPQNHVTTANEIHIPTGQPVQLVVNTFGVRQNLWIPELQAAVDAIPGQTSSTLLTAAEAGTFRGACEVWCGLQPMQMDLLVVAESDDEFADWLTNQQQLAPVPEDPVRLKGLQTFLGSACVYCHTIGGTNATGKIGPDLTHLASRQTIGAGAAENNRGSLAGWIIDSQGIKRGNQMPPMHLDRDQLQALLIYLEGLK